MRRSAPLLLLTSLLAACGDLTAPPIERRGQEATPTILAESTIPAIMLPNKPQQLTALRAAAERPIRWAEQ